MGLALFFYVFALIYYIGIFKWILVYCGCFVHNLFRVCLLKFLYWIRFVRFSFAHFSFAHFSFAHFSFEHFSFAHFFFAHFFCAFFCRALLFFAGNPNVSLFLYCEDFFIQGLFINGRKSLIFAGTNEMVLYCENFVIPGLVIAGFDCI